MAYGQIRSSSGRVLNLTPEGWINNEGENLNALSGIVGQSPSGNRLKQLVELDYASPKVQLANGVTGYRGKGVNAKNLYDAEGNLVEANFMPGEAEKDRERQKFDAEMKLAASKAKLLDAQASQAANKRPNAPVGFMWNEQGTGVVKIPGFEDEKPLTEFEGKSAIFGSRAQNSNDVIERVGKDGKVQPSIIKQAVESVPVIGGALGLAANAVVASPEQQQIEQAQRDFINAVLRQESGAVISPSEFDNAKKQYFPQPGDSPSVVAQKAANRQLVINGFKAEAGKGWGRVQKLNSNQGPRNGIPDGAIAMLKGNPLLRDYFDQQFGPGSAAAILGG